MESAQIQLYVKLPTSLLLCRGIEFESVLKGDGLQFHRAGLATPFLQSRGIELNFAMQADGIEFCFGLEAIICFEVFSEHFERQRW